jgi:hypothetical protein
MRDNALYDLLCQAALAGLKARGWPRVAVRQSFQPEQQGRASATTLYLTKIADRRHGSPAIRAVYDPEDGRIVRREIQVIESTFQITALISERKPRKNDQAEATAADLLKTAAAILQGEDFRAAIFKEGVQVLRVQEIRNPPFSNDRDRFEFSPSFDAVFTHHDVFTARDPAIDRFDWEIKRV